MLASKCRQRMRPKRAGQNTALARHRTAAHQDVGVDKEQWRPRVKVKVVAGIVGRMDIEAIPHIEQVALVDS